MRAGFSLFRDRPLVPHFPTSLPRTRESMVQPAVFLPVRQEGAEKWTPAFAGVTGGGGGGQTTRCLERFLLLRGDSPPKLNKETARGP